MLFAFDFMFSFIFILFFVVFIFAFVIIFVKKVHHTVNSAGGKNSVKIIIDGKEQETTNPENPKELRCPYCGAPIHKTDSECEYCGSRL